MKFYNRCLELSELERINALSSEGLHVTVITGRRRVGKTRLVEEFIKGREHIYFFVTRKGEPLLLEGLANSVREKLGYSPRFVDWEEALEYLITRVEGELVLVFDEFQNLSFGSPSAFSQFQKVLDSCMNEKGKHIILMGSYVSMMNRIFTDEKEPLFGRATEYIRLKPLGYNHVHEICRDLGFNASEVLTLHSIFGGIPKYYEIIKKKKLEGKDPLRILEKAFYCDFPLLSDEVKNNLIEIFGRNYHTYFSILEAVAGGHNTLTLMSNKSGIKRDSISKYLSSLTYDFNILEYRVPVTERKGNSKKGRYFIRDEMTRFWFRFIWPNLTLIEQGSYKRVSEIVEKGLPMLISESVEALAGSVLIDKGRCEIAGQWWNRRGDEIDVVGIGRGEILLVEVKWRNRQAGVDICKDLLEKVALVDDGTFRKRRLLIISKGGFTKAAECFMVENDIEFWNGKRLFKELI